MHPPGDDWRDRPPAIKPHWRTRVRRLALRLRRAVRLIRESELFDPDYYGHRNPIVASLGLDPLLHYLEHGWRAGLDPHPLFDTAFYLHENPDVHRSGINPLVHFVLRGAAERRDPCAQFDTSFYLDTNPEAGSSGTNPVTHYLREGAARGHDPHPLFHTRYYLARYPDVARSGMNPLVHYRLHGATEGRRTRPSYAHRSQPPEPTSHPLDRQRAAGPIVERERVASPLDDGLTTRDAATNPGRPIVDVLVDLSTALDPDAVAAATRGLVPGRDGVPGDWHGALTFVLPDAAGARGDAPPGVMCLCGPDRAIEAANAAISGAARHRRALLVVLGPVAVAESAIGAMLAAVGEDPYYGVAIPRVVGADGLVRPLIAGSAPVEAMPPDALPLLPAHQLVTEVVTPCFLVRSEVAGNLGGLDPEFSSARGAWLHYLARARRIGFRCVLVNGAAVRELAPSAPEPQVAELPEPVEDTQRLFRLFPDAEFAREALQTHEGLAREALVGRLRSRHGELRRTLVLDARGVPDGFTGTTDAALGVADGLYEVAPDWQVTLVIGTAAARFHRLDTRYPRWRIVERADGLPRATLGLRLSQPWFTQELIDLHEWSWVNAHWILDNILLDAGYGAPPTLAATWNVLAETADAVVYDSHFTQDRFVRRVPAAQVTPGIVQHFALHPSAYGGGDTLEVLGPGDHVFVVGSAHDHKHVAATVDVLARAFPSQPIVVLGPELPARPNVTVVPTGRVDPLETVRLYARSRVVVFPSFYEGFGFPVLRGLSAGRPVAARRSALLDEIAAHYRGPGRLAGYTFDAELADVVGQLLAGAPVDGVPIGTALGAEEEPLRWTDVARKLLGRLDALANDPAETRWLRRERRIAEVRSIDRSLT